MKSKKGIFGLLVSMSLLFVTTTAIASPDSKEDATEQSPVAVTSSASTTLTAQDPQRTMQMPLSIATPLDDDEPVQHFIDIREDISALSGDVATDYINIAADYEYHQESAAPADWTQASAYEYQGVTFVTVPLESGDGLQIGNHLTFQFDGQKVAQVAEMEARRDDSSVITLSMWQNNQLLATDSYSELEAAAQNSQVVGPQGFVKRVFLSCLDRELRWAPGVAEHIWALCGAICTSVAVPVCAGCVAAGAGVDLSVVIYCAQKAWS